MPGKAVCAALYDYGLRENHAGTAWISHPYDAFGADAVIKGDNKIV
jgi:hypothetical protein